MAFFSEMLPISSQGAGSTKRSCFAFNPVCVTLSVSPVPVSQWHGLSAEKSDTGMNGHSFPVMPRTQAGEKILDGAPAFARCFSVNACLQRRRGDSRAARVKLTGVTRGGFVVSLAPGAHGECVESTGISI